MDKTQSSEENTFIWFNLLKLVIKAAVVFTDLDMDVNTAHCQCHHAPPPVGVFVLCRVEKTAE